MDGDDTRGSELLSHVLVPVADGEDALASATALEPYGPARVTVVHVVEKGEGVPDKTPVAQSEAIAEDAYEALRSVFPDAASRTAYGRDVVSEIGAVAHDVEASSVSFRSRGGNRLTRFLAGDHALKLVTRLDLPVIALPSGTET